MCFPRRRFATRVANRLVLDEALFMRLQEDPEAQMAHEGLAPLEDRLHAWLDSLSAPIAPATD